jgi:hypothetical protein
MLNKEERKVLKSLCDGDISFIEAAKALSKTETEIEKLLDDFDWLPSPERLVELSKYSQETSEHIRKITHP